MNQPIYFHNPERWETNDPGMEKYSPLIPVPWLGLKKALLTPERSWWI
jgi:hypothetical protein